MRGLVPRQWVLFSVEKHEVPQAPRPTGLEGTAVISVGGGNDKVGECQTAAFLRPSAASPLGLHSNAHMLANATSSSEHKKLFLNTLEFAVLHAPPAGLAGFSQTPTCERPDVRLPSSGSLHRWGQERTPLWPPGARRHHDRPEMELASRGAIEFRQAEVRDLGEAIPVHDKAKDPPRLRHRRAARTSEGYGRSPTAVRPDERDRLCLQGLTLQTGGSFANGGGTGIPALPSDRGGSRLWRQVVVVGQVSGIVDVPARVKLAELLDVWINGRWFLRYSRVCWWNGILFLFLWPVELLAGPSP